MKEYSVQCEWCGAMIGAPCVDTMRKTRTETLKHRVHTIREIAYNKHAEIPIRRED